MQGLMIWIVGLLCSSVALAHGDDHKEHAHAAPATVVETTAAMPTLRAESEQFELVARLYPDELGLYIDRWASNVPLLNAEVEVELNGRKAVAQFHADHGDYAVADADLLRFLNTPGEHALVFTIVAGSETDLLTGTLTVTAATPLALMRGGQPIWWLVGVVGLVLLVGCGLAVRALLRARKEGMA